VFSTIIDSWTATLGTATAMHPWVHNPTQPSSI
jgi:hypothetical protein